MACLAGPAWHAKINLALPLAAAAISIFAISTYDTDYLLVKADHLPEAVNVLREAGFAIDGN
jgi:hypothetical protein